MLQAACLETSYFRVTKELVDVSEQYLLDCEREYGNRSCDGGFMHHTFRWLQNHGALVREEDYPYENKQGKCRESGKPKFARVTRYTRFQNPDANAMKDALVRWGPVSVAFFCATPLFGM